MSETKVNVTSVTDLLLLGEAAKDVPPDQIVQALLKGICHLESDVSLYECLFTNIIHHYEPKEFEAEISCAILPELVIFLQKIQNELQTNALSYFFVENLTILLRLADVLQKLVEYLTLHSDRCQLYHSLVIFPEYLLRCYTIVRQNYGTMAQEADALEAMKGLYTGCKKILTTFLDLLCPRDAASRGSYFRSMDSDEEYECLAKVCTLLASVGNEISPIDSLLASDVWKAIFKLSTEHAAPSFTRNRTRWMMQIIITLNTGIDTSFNEIRTRNESSKQATIAFKLNAFLLRVLLKLLSLSKQHTSTEVFRPIIKTLLQIKACLRANTVCSELATGIDQYLHIGYMAIVENAFRADSFAKEFCQHDCGSSEEIHSFYDLLTHLVGLIVSNANDTNLVSAYCGRQNLLTHVCTLLRRSDALLCRNASLYKQLLIHCSGLLLLGARLRDRDAQKIIEETLVRMVLQEHFYTGLLGIDLWSVFVRYHSTQLLYGYFIFWKNINDHYSIFNTRPEQVFVKQLLLNLWTFLPTTQKVKIIDTHPVSERANDRLWATIELSGEIDETRSQSFAESVQKRLRNSINVLHQRPSVEAFYETLGLLVIADKLAVSSIIEDDARRFWNSLLEWSAIWNTPAAGCMFDCLQKCTERTPENIFHSGNTFALSDASAFVKCVLVKLMERTSPTVNLTPFIEPLLKDDCAFIAAQTYHLLRKLNDKKHPTAQQLLGESPHIQSQLARWRMKLPVEKRRTAGERLSVAHLCYRSQQELAVGSESCGDITMVVNNKIDELFPDDDDLDDDDFDDLDVDMLAENDSGAKRRKVEFTHSDGSESSIIIRNCLGELEAQGTRLGELLQTAGQLGAAQKGQLKRIISALTTVMDS